VKCALEPTGDDRHSTAVPGKREAKIRHAGAPTAPSGAPAQRAVARNTNVLGLLCALAAVALYLRALPYGWVWDDHLLVLSQGAGGVGAEGFRPLTSLLFRFEWALGYGTPVLAHWISILLHGLATWLFFRLALHLGAKPGVACASGLLFAAHQVHVEAVAYISGRPDLLATALVLATLLLTRPSQHPTAAEDSRWRIWAAYAAMAAAVLSDEVAIVTPLLLIGLDRWGPVRVPWRRSLERFWGFFAITLLYLIARYTVGGGGAPTPGSADAMSGIDPGAGGWAIPIAFFEYLKLLVIPHPLNAFRTLQASEAASWTARLAPFGALLVLALLVQWRRRDALARTGVLLLLFPLIPALPFPAFIGSFVVERGAYLASVGFCLIVASIYSWLAGRLPAARPILGLGAIAIAGVAALGTLVRIPAWKDNVSLLISAAAADPGDPKPHLTLVEYYMRFGNWKAALTEIESAIALDPKDHAAVSRRAELLNRLGRYSESEAAARRAIELDPKDQTSYAYLSDALMQQGKVEEAVAAGRTATAIDSTFAEGWYNYGVALAAYGDVDAAIHAYRRTVALQPNHVLALNNLGALMGSTGRLEEARDLYIRLVSLAPNSVEVHMNLALAYLRTGDRESAAKEREEVRKLDPGAVQRLDQVFGAYLKEHHEPPKRPAR
jgi:protein O-mannosyl-transferase